jgi:chloramphenicol 3-O-phosphotransferase
MRPKFFAGFHVRVVEMLGAESDVIVDYLVEFEGWWEELVGVLAGVDVWIVGVCVR